MTNEKTAELHPDLEPEEGTVVQTGDEEIPSSEGGQQENSLKAIYKKSRQDRSLVTREDEEENPDAKQIAQMVAEAQDEGEFEHTEQPDGFDLETRKEHGVEEGEEEIPDEEYVEQVDHETFEAEQEEEEEEEEQEEIVENKKENLDYEVNDGKVKVVVEGAEYLVPEADVHAAGGIVQYQMNRASNIRFQKAATFGKALQKEREDLAQQQPDSAAKKGDLPEEDDLSKKAEFVKKVRERVLDAALEGTDADVDSIIEEILEKQSKPSKPSKAPNSPNGDDPLASDQVVEEYEVQYKLDRATANTMLSQDYSDVMDNPDLRKIASSKYKEIEADPRSAGRTAVEMAREAGDFVRRISHAPKVKKDKQDAELVARRTKKRVLPQGSEARTRHVPLETEKPRSNKEYIQELRRKQGNR